MFNYFQGVFTPNFIEEDEFSVKLQLVVQPDSIATGVYTERVEVPLIGEEPNSISITIVEEDGGNEVIEFSIGSKLKLGSKSIYIVGGLNDAKEQLQEKVQ